jgi:hypothetical protein
MWAGSSGKMEPLIRLMLDIPAVYVTNNSST